MKLRDYLIIGILGIIFLISFIIINFSRPTPGSIAGVYVAGEKIIEIDFGKNQFNILVTEEEYPKIIHGSETSEHYVEIILLGKYIVEGKQTEITIEISYTKKAIRIKKDSTPKQIGVNRSWYNGNGLPVVSLPNFLYIIFESGQTSDVDGAI